MTDKKQTIIKPQTLKGFRDFFGADVKLREYVVGVFKETFEKYGYEPLETPVLEYGEVLLGKAGGEVEKLQYIFNDPGGRQVGMKFDMTVPACRYVAQNLNELTLPFKRYQIQLAWRAENTQSGRFREFMQCDADVWGTTSVLVDAEFIQMGIEATKRLGFQDFVTRINNRKIINGIFAYSGASADKFYAIAISVDKLAKIGLEGVRSELLTRGLNQQVIDRILQTINLPGTSLEKLTKLKNYLATIPEALEGIAEVEKIFAYLKDAGVNPNYYMYDPGIIRGMSYYTGPVWEVTVSEGGVGSIAGCGRYDNLTGKYIGRDLPASGGSFGIERIIEILKARKMLTLPSSNAKVLVTIFSPELQTVAIAQSNSLRSANIKTELYLDPEAKLAKQFKYANSKGIPWVVIIGPDEATNNKVTLKNMQTGQQETLSTEEVIVKLK